MRWGRGATRCLHLHGGILFYCWCRHDMRWHGGVVYNVYRWEHVRGRRFATCRLQLLGWVLFACWCRYGVRRHVSVVHGLPGWEFVRGQCLPASGLHVYCGVRLDERDIGWVYNDHWDVLVVPGWECVRRWLRATGVLHMQRWLLLAYRCCYGMRWRDGVVHIMLGREFVCRRLRGARCVHVC